MFVCVRETVRYSHGSALQWNFSHICLVPLKSSAPPRLSHSVRLSPELSVLTICSVILLSACGSSVWPCAFLQALTCTHMYLLFLEAPSF